MKLTALDFQMEMQEVTSVRLVNPGVWVVKGLVNGQPTMLVQAVGQSNFALTAETTEELTLPTARQAQA